VLRHPVDCQCRVHLFIVSMVFSLIVIVVVVVVV